MDQRFNCRDEILNGIDRSLKGKSGCPNNKHSDSNGKLVFSATVKHIVIPKYFS